ncbi:hypothetical protein ACP70R_004475 [Stipagrostis hirtigluma subsp. patula]
MVLSNPRRRHSPPMRHPSLAQAAARPSSARAAAPTTSARATGPGRAALPRGWAWGGGGSGAREEEGVERHGRRRGGFAGSGGIHGSSTEEKIKVQGCIGATASTMNIDIISSKGRAGIRC